MTDVIIACTDGEPQRERSFYDANIEIKDEGVRLVLCRRQTPDVRLG